MAYLPVGRHCILRTDHQACSVATRSELKNTINEDAVCTQLLTYLNTGWPEAKKLFSVAVQPYFLIRHELRVSFFVVNAQKSLLNLLRVS